MADWPIKTKNKWGESIDKWGGIAKEKSGEMKDTWTKEEILKLIDESNSLFDLEKRLDNSILDEVYEISFTREHLEIIDALSRAYESGAMNRKSQGSSVHDFIKEINPNITKTSVDRFGKLLHEKPPATKETR